MDAFQAYVIRRNGRFNQTIYCAILRQEGYNTIVSGPGIIFFPFFRNSIPYNQRESSAGYRRQRLTSVDIAILCQLNGEAAFINKIEYFIVSVRSSRRNLNCSIVYEDRSIRRSMLPGFNIGDFNILCLVQQITRRGSNLIDSVSCRFVAIHQELDNILANFFAIFSQRNPIGIFDLSLRAIDDLHQLELSARKKLSRNILVALFKFDLSI